jgi:hypothetical protein
MQSIKEIVEELALNNLLPRFPASPDPGKDAVPIKPYTPRQEIPLRS